MIEINAADGDYVARAAHHPSLETAFDDWQTSPRIIAPGYQPNLVTTRSQLRFLSLLGEPPFAQQAVATDMAPEYWRSQRFMSYALRFFIAKGLETTRPTDEPTNNEPDGFQTWLAERRIDADPEGIRGPRPMVDHGHRDGH